MSMRNEILYGLCTVVLALQLTAVCTEHWGVKTLNIPFDNINADVSMGLWKACGESWGKIHDIRGETDICLDLPIHGMKSFPKNSLYATRCFAIIGVILVFMALVYRNNKTFQLVCLVSGGLASLIAMIIWASELLKIKIGDNLPSVKFKPGYSFYLNLSGGVMALAAAATLLL